MDSRAKELVRIGERLFTRKQPWNDLCQELADNLYPLRADFTTSFTLGEDFSLDIMDSFPVQARETLGNAPSAMLRQGKNWFSVKTGYEELDEDPEVARWLEGATTRFRRLIYDRRARFVRATNEADHDWVTFGNPVLSVEESPTRDHFLFRSWHPKECAWMENAVGVVDHLQRHMPTTARNIASRWKNVHANIEKAARDEPDREFKVRHIVLPFDEIYGDDKARRRKARGNPFVSVYIDCEHEEVLGEGSLPVFNYVVPRWRTISGYPYGFSPAAIGALPDARMLQALSRIVLEQGEKALDPPIVAKGEIFRDAVNLYAGGMTYVDLEGDQDIRQAIQALETGSGLSGGLELKQDARMLISEAFLLNKLMLPNAREMREIEVQARLDEFRRAALPFFGPIESGYHLPLLDTAFQMAVVNQQFDFSEMPEKLQSGEVTFTFDSPLATAEGRAAVVAFQESVQIVAASAQFDQNAVNIIDLTKATKDAVKGTGAPADWFNDEQTEEAKNDQSDQAANLMKMAEFLRGGAAVAGDVANATVAMKQAGIATP